MDLLRQFAAIAVVFAMLWAALWFLKRRGALRPMLGKSAAGPRLIESRGRLALTAQHSVHWVRAGNREVLIGVHPSGLTLIGEISAASLAAPEPPLR